MRHLFQLFLLWLAAFAVGKVAFVVLCATEPVSAADVASILWHGLPMDLATASYIIIVPLVLNIVATIWPAGAKRGAFLTRIAAAYNLLAATLFVIAAIADIALYPFWGFKLDATVLNYIDSPANAVASVPLIFVAGHLCAAIFLIAALTWLANRLGGLVAGEGSRSPIRSVLIRLLLIAALIPVIRGGLKESTMNVGNAYFSDRAFLNHAAVNPLFSFFESIEMSDHFNRLYRAMPDEEARAIVDSLFGLPPALPKGREPSPSTDALPTDPQQVYTPLPTREGQGGGSVGSVSPSILLIIWEGCGARLTALDTPADIPSSTPCLDSIAATAISFTNLHATSFRTDRGVLSILSGNPAYPSLSLMKMPTQAGRLPSLALSLQRAGYSTHFTYGGDINFTNMKGYLLDTGFEQVTADTDFPAEARRTAKWGVCDSLLFDHLYTELTASPSSSPSSHSSHTSVPSSSSPSSVPSPSVPSSPSSTPSSSSPPSPSPVPPSSPSVEYAATESQPPFFHVALTLSSHEPWDVPGHDPTLPEDAKKRHTFRYTDRQLGRFLRRLRATPLWKDLLVIILPDHGLVIDDVILREDPRFYRIPMVWTGGALRNSQATIPVLMSQSDLAATLLARLGLPHDDFPWSRDVLSPNYTRPFAYSAFNDGILFTDTTGTTVYDNKAARTVRNIGPDPDGHRLRAGLAIQQVSYDQLEQR